MITKKFKKEAQFKNILREAINNEIKIIVTGKSGWGKSEMVSQVADDLNLELIDFRLSEVLPEDLVGIPKLRDDYYEYVPPRWLYEVVNNPDKKYLLFLDEITQATPEVLNICYKIFDKKTRIGSYTLDNVSVVGATNYSDESPYINELPIPLKNRACMIELNHNLDEASNYLINKYSLPVEVINDINEAIKESNPRSVDTVIKLILNNASKNICVPFVTHTGYSALQILKSVRPDNTLSHFTLAEQALETGRVNYNGDLYRLQDPKSLEIIYSLTDEEKVLLDKKYETDYTDKGLNLDCIPSSSDIPLKNYILSTVLVDKYKTLSKEETKSISDNKDFNVVSYIRKCNLNPDTAQFLLDATADKYTTEECFEKVFSLRDIPLETMMVYRDKLPWNKIIQSKRSLTQPKLKEFEKEIKEAEERIADEKSLTDIKKSVKAKGI